MSLVFGRYRAVSGVRAPTSTERGSKPGQPSTDGINLGVEKRNQPGSAMQTTVRPAEVFTLKPAKRRKKKASVAAAVCSAQVAPPAASVVRSEGSVQKAVKKKKKKKSAAGGTDLMDGAVCAASSSSAIEPVTVTAIAPKEDGLEGIFASFTEKKAARDAKRKVREEEEAEEAAAAAAAAKKAAKEARSLPRDSVFGEPYDPNVAFDPMSAPIHRVRQHGQKWGIPMLEDTLRPAARRLPRLRGVLGGAPG
jgi:hypothetical protein